MRKVASLFLGYQWSPEQISNRLKHENSADRVSYNTIYRAIYSGMFNTAELRRKYDFNKASRKLRHRGKRRKKANVEETRGKIVILRTIRERPEEANNRSEIGNWELDTLLGKQGSSCLITSVDRKSRYIVAGKIAGRKADSFKDKMIEMYSSVPLEHLGSFTPDNGKEMAKHLEISEALNGVQFYFADAGCPWQRGTNEHFNGLLREYFPKGCDFDKISDEEIKAAVDNINKRPLKCLDGLTPYEVYHDKVLHLI